jgi:hypothetical protein
MPFGSSARRRKSPNVLAPGARRSYRINATTKATIIGAMNRKRRLVRYHDRCDTNSEREHRNATSDDRPHTAQHHENGRNGRNGRNGTLGYHGSYSNSLPNVHTISAVIAWALIAAGAQWQRRCRRIDRTTAVGSLPRRIRTDPGG